MREDLIEEMDKKSDTVEIKRLIISNTEVYRKFLGSR